MEKLVLLALPFLFLPVLRLAGKSANLLLRAGQNALLGMGALLAVNSLACFTGLALPINAITVLLAGFLGLPGVALVAVLA